MKNKKEKILSFVKKYGYYAMAFVLVLGITLGIVFSVKPTEIKKDIPTDSKPIVFSLPVEAPKVIKWYSDENLMYNETLKQWESHMAIDMTSDNLNVYSILDGVVTNIETSYENGTVITVAHKDGFVSKYSSLSDDVFVKVSMNVQKGQKLGLMSSSASVEVSNGNHLHFEMLKDGKHVDPANYLTLENK